MSFDVSRAILKNKAKFKPFQVSTFLNVDDLLNNNILDDDEGILIFKFNKKHYGLLTRQMAYHHVANGDIDGEPFMISFWAVCNTGVRMTPIVNNERLKFEASGLYDGLVLLGDTKTRSYWSHITGECLHGHYIGEVLEVSNLLHYTFKTAIEEFPYLKIAISKPPFPYNLLIKMFALTIRKSGFIPPFFRKTMTSKDKRLDENEIGLGVVVNGQAKYYNIDKIMDAELLKDHFAGKDLLISFDIESKIPRCTVKDSDELPIQLYTRWYGFSYTYKNCEIYKER